LNAPHIAVVIAAAGTSTRFKNNSKKEYQPFVAVSGGHTASDKDGKPLTVLGATVSAFTAIPRVSAIVIAVPPTPETGEAFARKALPAYLLSPSALPPILFTAGGGSRRSSVRAALTALSARRPDYVLIHDGARPWVPPDLINRLIDAMLVHKAAIPALPVNEPLVELDDTGHVLSFPPPRSVVSAQTPQGFAFDAILEAHEKAEARMRNGRDSEYTDDAEIWGELVGPVAVVPGDVSNRKITFAEDL
jgi:2-C-methyl-D-erythritol 4-phosphate cytidylyltransferase/2-C-methyl-D-erythritol 4-phosphate cytidylyltransferase/2-C-methyl-D-erythritol 2,4-cyclodiphosphate synthase